MALQLPRAFALKLSSINKFLACVTKENEAKKLLKFGAEDINDSTAVFEWEPAKSGGAGLVHLKCSYNNKYWVRRESDHSLWIAAEGDKPVEDKASLECTLFEVIPAGGDGSEINLKQVGVGFYVVAWPSNEPLNLCLYADGPQRGGLDTFSVTALVPISTEISDVKFRLADAKIKNPTTVILATKTIINTDQVSSVTVSGALDSSVVESSTWNLASSSLTLGLTPIINSAVPIIVNGGKVELSGEVVTGLSIDSGKPMDRIVDNKISYQVTVPPQGKVEMALKATHASADIPFSYTEGIFFANGGRITRHVDDGIFTRFNYYDIQVIKNA